MAPALHEFRRVWSYCLVCLSVLLTKQSVSYTIKFNRDRFLPNEVVVPAIDIPRLLEDPLTVPVLNERYFVFSQGTLNIELEAHKALPNDDDAEASDDQSPYLNKRTLGSPFDWSWTSGLGHLSDGLVEIGTVPDSNNSAYSQQENDLWLLVSNEHQLTGASTSTNGILSWRNLFVASIYRRELSSKVNMTMEFKNNLSPIFVLIINPKKIPYKLEGSISLVNSRSSDRHLSVSHRHLQSVALYGSLVFLSIGLAYCLWLGTVGSRAIGVKIHRVFVGLVLLRSLYLYVDYLNISSLAKSGELGWLRVHLPRVLAKSYDICVLMTFLLLSLGWSVYRPDLTQVERRFCGGVGILSLYLAICEVPIGGFQVSRYILSTLADLCIMVAINFNVVFLRTSLMDRVLTDSTVANIYGQVRAYSMFRVIFVTYVVKPSFLLAWNTIVIGQSLAFGKHIVAAMDIAIDAVCMSFIMYEFGSPRQFQIFKMMPPSGSHRST